MQAKVASIICHEIEILLKIEDLSWTDDEDVNVDNMLRIINEGFKFTNQMFKGDVFPRRWSSPKDLGERVWEKLWEVG